MYSIGKIINTHGLKGELKIMPSTEDIERFKKLSKVFLERKTLTEQEIETVRFHKNMVLLKFKGIDTIEEAEKLKNSIIKINKEDALPLNENEYYINDLYDMKVVTDEGIELGIIEDIMFTSANDVYVVKTQTKPVLIPAIKQCILNVDVPNNTMTIKVIKGLLD
ncbi:16S rRNA processing protein RimM [Candidatus Epulonipiscium fishelsonii]|uniref:16S rRNA processing protein RimM n=1 Tax=Candidatus Epulonipiscium fishelsonii TaxID=77094 RepID=A0ACC8XGU5_9FIRM|nr:16S rRNA processing protein RimM [Epulopiscium sp. SCG-B05WGA-EpuloA1]ONI42741.1 16S rRNA processing protein RimM [Epulopiscium sp. SCG-B11WGA-EpuloA1]